MLDLKLCMLLSDQYMFLWPSELFFVPCVPEAQLLCALSSPSEQCPTLGIFSAAAQVCCYFPTPLPNAIGRAIQQVTPTCVWQNHKAEKHQEPPKDNTWSVIIWKRLRTRWGNCCYLKPHCNPILCTAHNFHFCSLRIQQSQRRH